jgi:hypothetical protein
MVTDRQESRSVSASFSTLDSLIPFVLCSAAMLAILRWRGDI